MLVDIVRHVIVNVHPPNEVIFESDVFQRYVLIGNLISQLAHQYIQPWVLQSLFFDWLCYDDNQPSSIMLVEPAMLLMYRSAENNPSMTDMLVEYLNNYVNFYEECRQFEFMLSV